MVGYSNISRICTRIEKSTPKREVILVARRECPPNSKIIVYSNGRGVNP